MRVVLFVVILLSGCGNEPPGALLAADAASIVVFGRGLVDLGYSAVSGRDCSVVRLDRGQTYCAPRTEPVRLAYCTRTLGTVDCWASPTAAPLRSRLVEDTPPPTRAQEAYREARWPKSLTAPE